MAASFLPDRPAAGTSTSSSPVPIPPCRLRCPLDPPSDARDERRHPPRVARVLLAELNPPLALLTSRQPHVHPDEDWEHREREERRPLEEEPEHGQDEPDVL